MKKLLSLILAFTFVFTLSACRDGNDTSFDEPITDTLSETVAEGTYVTNTQTSRTQTTEGTTKGKSKTTSSQQHDSSQQSSSVSQNNSIIHNPQNYIKKSNDLIVQGKLKLALQKLYEGIEICGNSKDLDDAISSFFDRITFKTTINPAHCDPKYCHKDTTYQLNDMLYEKDLGLILFDNKTKHSETIARITLKYEDTWTPRNSDTSVVANNGDTWLFYVYTGAGISSAFLYTIHSNKLFITEKNLTEWYVNDNYLVGQPLAYAVDGSSSIYTYNWNGKLSYCKSDTVGNAYLKDNYIFYVKCQYKNSGNVWQIYKLNIDGKSEKLYRAFKNIDCLWIQDNKIIYYENGEECQIKL